MRDALVPQDGLYTLLERDASGERAAIVGSLVRYLYAPDERDALVAAMAAARTRIVSLTVTEGGYGRNDIVCGLLADALARRRATGVPAFTLVSCDNLQGNGEALRHMLLGYLEPRERALAAWVEREAAFPSSMVDRITPRTGDVDREHVRREYGIDDAWPVVCEPFIQWVLEDRFAAGRPAWEQVGVQMVRDVAPYELMKLRLLNAGHSALGYSGILRGHATVHGAMGDAELAGWVGAMLREEVKPMLPPVPGIDLDGYIDTVLRRFANPAVADRLARICADGSSKLPKFVLPSIRERLARGGPMARLARCVAAWIRYLQSADVEDPMRERLVPIALRAGEDPRPLLGIAEIFGADLPRSPRFVEAVATELRALEEP